MIKIQLTRPQDKGIVSRVNPHLQWKPPPSLSADRGIFLDLTVFSTRPGTRPGRRTKLLPIFTTRIKNSGGFSLPIRDKGLRPDRTYWWQVRALDKNRRVVAISERWRFRVEAARTPAGGLIAEAHPPQGGAYRLPQGTGTARAPFWPDLLASALPPAPGIWGKPVILRPRPETPTEPPSEPGGATEPIHLIWGDEADEIFLPYYLATHAALYWDLTHIDRCQWVLLQISSSDGFSQPVDGDVMHDENVINYYWGPPRLSCGFDEIETSAGPPPAGSLIPSVSLDLLRSMLDSGTVPPPSEFIPEIVRQLRLIPCDEDREQIDLASAPVTLRAVRNPAISIGAQEVEYTWGDNPRRTVDFSVFFEERFPNVNALREDEETGRMVPVEAPSTLLIYAAPRPSMLDSGTCSNISLTMGGVPVERRNNIRLSYDHPFCDTYVIPLDSWPTGGGFDFRLIQEWQGGILPITLWDFLDPLVVAAVIPGVHPAWHYCGGVYHDYDSLYGRDDLPEEGTDTPYYSYPAFSESGCLPGDIVVNWLHPCNGYTEFNAFMESTFRGTRTVTYDLAERGIATYWVDETEGERDVVVRFETEGTGDLRFAVPSLSNPVIMRETRGSAESPWKVDCLDGRYASLRPGTDFTPIIYGGRTAASGRSRFDPPRLEMWLWVRLGVDDRGWGESWAEVHYDLRAD